MVKKSSTLCIASRTPGNCAGCRHANQGTVDFAEGLILCRWDVKKKGDEQVCDVQVELPQDVGDKSRQPYFLYEPFDGNNATWYSYEDGRLLAEDASAAQRRVMQADKPVIPGEER